MAKLIVTSSTPDRRRGGGVFTGATAFELDHFTGAQLKAIVADPVLTVVIGEVITADGIDDFIKVVAADKKAAPKAKA